MTRQILILDGLPAFFVEDEIYLFRLIGRGNRKARQTFVSIFKHQRIPKGIELPAARNQEEGRILSYYSAQVNRFESFWRMFLNPPAPRTGVLAGRGPSKLSTQMLERERDLVAPDLLLYLLNAYDPCWLDQTVEAGVDFGCDINQIKAKVLQKLEGHYLGPVEPDQLDFRALLLWPRLLEDLASFGARPKPERETLAGAAFAVASAYDSPELLELALSIGGEALSATFAPFFRVIEEPASPVNSGQVDTGSPSQWTSAIAKLSRLVENLGQAPDDLGITAIEEAVKTLREIQALQEDEQGQRDRMNELLRGIEDQAAAIPSLPWFVEMVQACRTELSRLEGDKWNAMARDLKERADRCGSLLEAHRGLGSQVQVLTNHLQTLEIPLTASFEERKRLGKEQIQTRGRLNELSAEILDLEFNLQEALNLGQRPQDSEVSTEPEWREAIEGGNASEGSKDETGPSVVIPANSTFEHEAEVESEPEVEPVVQTELILKSTTKSKPLAVPLRGISTEVRDAPDIPENNHRQEFSMEEMLTALVASPKLLTERCWHGLVDLQHQWLAQCEPMRAWILADAFENARRAMEEHVEGTGLMPAWACRILLHISDPRLPLSDTDLTQITNDLYLVRSMEGELKEIITLWLTACLFRSHSGAPVRVARQVSPKLFDLAPHGLANACAEHLLFPVFNGGTLHPPRSQAEFHREFEQALQEAEEILNPVRNTYQTSLVRSFWRDMIRPSGPMGRTLAEARCQQFPAGRAGIDLFVEGHADWPKILAAYKHNIQNRMTEFGDLIEVARAAHLGGIEAKRPDNSHLPRQAVQEILEAVRHQGGSAWWLDAIEAGLAGM